MRVRTNATFCYNIWWSFILIISSKTTCCSARKNGSWTTTAASMAATTTTISKPNSDDVLTAVSHEEKEQNNKENDKNKILLEFGGTITRYSKTIPLTTNDDSASTTLHDTIHRFFQDEQENNLYLIASGGGTKKTEKVNSSSKHPSSSLRLELKEYWKECAKDTYGIENGPSPSESEDEVDDDPIYVTNTTMRCPGMLKLTTTTYNGMRVFLNGGGGGGGRQEQQQHHQQRPTNTANQQPIPMPKYVINMIGETQNPQGLKPIVWAFHKLFSNCQDQGSLKPCGRVQAIFSVEERSDEKVNKSAGINKQQKRKKPNQKQLLPTQQLLSTRNSKSNTNENDLVFSFQVIFKISFTVPKSLMNVTPMSKSKVEEMATSVIKKSISKDLDNVLDAVYKSFMNNEKCTTTATT